MCVLLLFALIMATAMAPPLQAEQIPTRGYLSISDASVNTVPVGDYQNGDLVKVNLWNCTPTNAIMNVKHVYTLGTTTVTNTIAAITGNLSGNGSATLTNVYLLPGDYLLFFFSSSSTGIVDYVRRVGN